MNTKKLKFWLLSIVILLQSITLCAQTTRKNTKPRKPQTVTVDSVIKPPPPALLIPGTHCTKGITDILVEIAPTDTSTVAPTWLYVYVAPEEQATTDTSVQKDSLLLHKVFSITDIEKNNFKLYLDKPGSYFVRTATGTAGKPVFSANSNIAEARFCSLIDFPGVFDKSQSKVYVPGPFINIQIQEFDIFDRIGNPAYSHKNNDIRWDGTYPNHTACPAGVYYFNCFYLDLTDNSGEKKSLSGMIELKP